MTESQRLFAEYRTSGSEPVFRELVARYTDLVYSAALRLVEGDTHRAEDVAQIVFADLARKAHRLSLEGALAGWLYRHTCFVAAKAMRGERRRQAREKEAAQMNAQDDHSEANFAQVAPVLDEAISQLGPEDQSAIVLRFFERMDFSSVGEALGSTEEAARKRVNRALDKLHDLLTVRGVTLSAAALGTALAARAVEAAPAQIAASLANAALAGAAAGHGTTLTLLKLMTTSKISLGVAGAVVLAGAAWLSWRQWWPRWPAKPSPLALNGTWTRLDKPQPLGHLSYYFIFALDPDGQLYIADGEEGGRIEKRDRNGNWSLVASGAESTGGFRGGTPFAMACDASGNLYVAELGRLEKRDREGHWTVLAAEGEGLGQVTSPIAMAVDRAGNLYVSDYKRIVLRKPDGEWTQLAGEGSALGEVEQPRGLALDTQGNLYVADLNAGRIQKRDATGHWSVVEVDPLSVGELEYPDRIVVDAGGSLYVAEDNQRLLKRDVHGDWSELAVPDVESAALLSIDPAGNLYVAAYSKGKENRWIKKRDPDGNWTVVCETLKEPGMFLSAQHLAVDSGGRVFVADPLQRQVQERDPDGHWTVALTLDAVNRRVDIRISLALDREGNLYVADQASSRVMKQTRRGDRELCMAQGPGVGQAQSPICVSVDASDNLYVIDRPFNPKAIEGRQGRPQKRDSRGRWTVLVDSGAEPDPQLGLADLSSVAAAPNGNIYVADGWNEETRLRMLDSKGRWTTLATGGDKLGQVSTVTALAADSFGRLYIADSNNWRLQIRDLDGKWRMLSEGREGRSADCPKSWPDGIASVAVDGHGVTYGPAKVLRWTPQPKTP
jgi:RNA polymerase sigma factor (sigma-70 family)